MSAHRTDRMAGTRTLAVLLATGPAFVLLCGACGSEPADTAVLEAAVDTVAGTPRHTWPADPATV